MPSALKSATARANGAKSKGPKTAATREISSHNSLRHGFTSRNTVLLQCEDPALYEHLRNEYIATYKPATAIESDLVDEMVVARWRIQRLWTIETALVDAEMMRLAETENPSSDPGIQLALAFRNLIDESRSIAVLSRYESRLHRIHDRAYRTLRQLQQDRQQPAPAQPAQPQQPENEKKNCESNPPTPEIPKSPQSAGVEHARPRSAAGPQTALPRPAAAPSEPQQPWSGPRRPS